MRKTGHAKYRNHGAGRARPMHADQQARWDAVLSDTVANVAPMPGELAVDLRLLVERLRAERGLSVNALAAAAGLGQRTLSRRLAEDAVAPLDADDLEGLAVAFSTTPQQLVEWAQR